MKPRKQQWITFAGWGKAHVWIEGYGSAMCGMVLPEYSANNPMMSADNHHFKCQVCRDKAAFRQINIDTGKDVP